MIYICQIIEESGSRSPAFPISSIEDFILDVHAHAIEKGEWEDVKKAGLLLIHVVNTDLPEDSIFTSALPVYSLDRYHKHLLSGVGLPDLQLSSLFQTVTRFSDEPAATSTTETLES